MTNLDSILKSRDITLPTKVCLVKAMVFPEVMYGCESWSIKKVERPRIDAFWKCGVGGDSWDSLGLHSNQTSQSYVKSILNIHSRDWCWGWSSNTLATWWEELTHWKRSWCWVILKAGGEGGDKGWDGWMASPIQWTWVWASSGRWWGTVRPGVLQSVGLQRVRHDWVTEHHLPNIINKIFLFPNTMKSEGLVLLWHPNEQVLQNGNALVWKQITMSDALFPTNPLLFLYESAPQVMSTRRQKITFACKSNHSLTPLYSIFSIFPNLSVQCIFVLSF